MPKVSRRYWKLWRRGLLCRYRLARCNSIRPYA